MCLKDERTRAFFLFLWAAVLILLSPFQAGSFSVNGKLNVCAYPYNCIEKTKPTQPLTYLYDTDDLMGPGNNWAIAEYYIDIASGFAGAWVKATRGWDGVWWRPASASTSSDWQDILRFTIPAGSYPEGLHLEASGSVTGSVGKSGAGTQAFAGFFAKLGDEPSGYFSGKVELESNDDDQVVIVDERFVLTATLITAGTVLPNPITVDVSISAGFGNPPLAANTWAGGIYEAWTQSDFAGSLRIESITAPPGVTWDSESGAFLTRPVGSCRGDFDGDGDVDGNDAATLSSDPDRLDLILFAAQYGRVDCQTPN
jgi:hypothetical protein